MHNFILQDWNSFAGLAGSTTFTQDESGWLDLAPFQDVVVYVDCRETSAGAPTIAFETSPCREDGLFQMATMTMSSAGTQPKVVRALMLGSTVPLARYLRWKLTGPAGAWETTFRAIVVANSPGM
jgi:hypothetical protein